MTEQKRDLPKIKAGWEERFAQYQSYPDLIQIEISLKGEDFTSEELERTLAKFELVKEFAKGLCMGMIKGTAKYEHDRWSEEQFGNGAEDEEYDLVNYRLLRNAEQQRRIREAWEGVTRRTVEVPPSHAEALLARVIAPTYGPNTNPEEGLVLDAEQTGQLLRELDMIRQLTGSQSLHKIHEVISDMVQGRDRPDDFRPSRLASEQSTEPELDMHEIARRNGFRLEGDRLIQTDF